MCHECIIKAWVTHASVGPSGVVGGSDERTLTPISLSGGMTESIGRLTSQGEIGRVSLSLAPIVLCLPLSTALCAAPGGLCLPPSLSLSLLLLVYSV